MDSDKFIWRMVGAARNSKNGRLNKPVLTGLALALAIRQAVPVAGSFVGPSDALIGMTVEVSVTS